jgi:AcrR family transcriptional regulator
MSDAPPDQEAKSKTVRKPGQRRSRTSLGAVRNPASHEAILVSAAEILEDQGYGGFTMDAVVKRAASSKPTIYRWWRNKGALIMDVYERAGEAALRQCDTGDLEADLTAHIQSLWAWWGASRSSEAIRSFIIEAQRSPQAIEELRERFVPRRERAVREIFARAVERGEIERGPEMDAAITLLMSASWLALMTGNFADIDQVTPLVRVVTQGVVKRLPAPQENKT